MLVTDDDGLRAVLAHDAVAVVGCSTTPGKAAHDVPAYLQRHGYDVHPVNPYADEVLGRPAVGRLGEVPADVTLVNVFRPSDEVPGIVDAAIERRESRGDVEALWCQLGIGHDAAAERAVEAGLDVVQDRCMKVEHRRLVGD